MTNNNKPNVVYILTDQWRAKATGYNADPNAITPNIDRLAAESIDFANAIATSPALYTRTSRIINWAFPYDHGHVYE